MQINSNGIPCNVGFNFKLKSNTISKRQMLKSNKNKEYVELVRFVKGLQETIIMPYNKREYKQALKDGYVFVKRWTVN